MPRGERLRLRVAAALNGLNAADVRVEFVARRRLPAADVEQPALSSYQAPTPDGLWVEHLQATGEIEADGCTVFALDAQTTECGQFDTEVRIYPYHELLTHPFEVGLMKRL
jgi:starch phosphorylase